jgi:putative sigma-54 modulation protein
MRVSITFRHVDPSEAMKQHAKDKCSKLQKFLRKPMTARVTLSLDKLRHAAEVQVSSGGEHFEAHETTDDMYAAIDKVMAKLERQIRGSHGAAQSKKRRGGETVRASRPPKSLETAELVKAAAPKKNAATKKRSARGAIKKAEAR